MLPANATPRSHQLASIAQAIAERAPTAVSEIILEGSVARGLADGFSDIELQFFSEQVPPAEEMITIMKAMGFRGEPLIRHNEAGHKLIDDEYDHVRIELGWRSFTYEAEQLDGVMDRIGGDLFVNEAYKWPDAIPLCDGPHIRQSKALFDLYPDSIRNKYIQPVLNEWRNSLNDPIDTLGRWKDAYRHAWFYLLKTHWIDLLPLLRIIFAYNRVWEPVAKWWHAVDPKLTYKPDNLVERINDVLSNPNPVARIDQFSRLQLETLHIIKAEYEVWDLIEGFEAVREYGLQMGKQP